MYANERAGGIRRIPPNKKLKTRSTVVSIQAKMRLRLTRSSSIGGHACLIPRPALQYAHVRRSRNDCPARHRDRRQRLPRRLSGGLARSVDWQDHERHRVAEPRAATVEGMQRLWPTAARRRERRRD